MKKYSFPVLIIFLVALFGYGFRDRLFSLQNNSSSKNNKIMVTASFYPLYFFASEIGGNKAIVNNITPVGAEPHDYEPTPRDIARIENSDLLVLNGGALEAWGDKITTDLHGSNVTVIIAGQKIIDQHISGNGQTVLDPHVWLSPPLAKKEAEVILNGFIKIDPKDKNYYVSNFGVLSKQLDELDREYKTGLKQCKQKNIITSHAAFGYLAKEYGLNQETISGITPDEEPSAQKMAEISQFAKNHDVKYIFFESLVNPRLSETIANEIGAKTMVLNPIEGVTDKEMQSGENYFTIMKSNLNNLRIALECQ